ncbi:MAG: polysaccharide pyruvyl transferase CsaB [Clostridia bacterium]|nr:polysaccharide pyruvyl transferase CsaB [Clostridia bacterium]
MKIMLIAGGGDKGGAKTHILALCSRLKETCDLTLVSLRDGDFPEDAIAMGIRTETFYSGNVPLDYIRLIQYARKERPDIVHCHGAKANLAGVLLKAFTGATIVTTVHSDYKLDYMHSALKRNTIGRLNSAALRFFDYYTSVSDNFLQMLLKRGFDPLKIMTIYNGLDFTSHAQKVNRKEYLAQAGLAYNDGDIVLGIPARLNPVKDIGTLLRAFALAKKEVPNLKLLIGGDGEDMDKLIALSKELRLEDSVSFMGWLKDIPTFFSACDIDVLCSISESFPYSILEGIREGCAVITSDVGGMRDLIESGESGYIFLPGDYKTFASYIVDLAKDSEKRRRFASKLYDVASKRYSLESMAATQQKIYEDILALESRNKRRDGVLICGAYGFDNAGDDAILAAIVREMHEIDPNMPLTVITKKPAQTRSTIRCRAVYTFNFPKLFSALRHASLYINGGGTLMQDKTSTKSLLYYLATIKLAKMLKTPVMLYGSGIGPISRPGNRRIAGRILNSCADVITLRDEASLQELRSLGVTRPFLTLTGDPAIRTVVPTDTHIRSLQLENGIDPDREYACVALRNWETLDEAANENCARFCDAIVDELGMQVVFLPMAYEADMPLMRSIAEKMKAPHICISRKLPVNDTVGLISKASFVFAMRLHALVFAASQNVPAVGFCYDIKVSSFLAYAGMPFYAELSNNSPEHLLSLAREAIAAKGAGKSTDIRTLAAKNRQYAELLIRNGQAVQRDDLESI